MLRFEVLTLFPDIFTSFLEESLIKRAIEKKLVMTGREEGASSKEFCDYILETIDDPELEQKWKSYQP